MDLKLYALSKSYTDKVVSESGLKGKDGVSITKTEINNKGELVITLSDDTVSNLGVVVGAEGEKGPQGNPGKNAYEYAKEGGFTGTEEEFAQKMTEEVPTKLSQLFEDETHRVVTDSEKATWNSKSNFSGSYNDLTDKLIYPSIADNSIVSGVDTVAGCKGYYIKSIDSANNIIYLSKTKVIPVQDLEGEYDYTDTSFETPAYESGDTFSVINGLHYPFCGTIDSISNNVVQFSSINDDYNFAEIKTDTEIDGHTFSVPTKPDVGAVTFTQGGFAEGENTYAVGLYSHAEGSNTIAASPYSHTEGYKTKAGHTSHAEGHTTQALGTSSHAEGNSTEALGDYSHAEGRTTLASRSSSHAEGYKTEAHGEASHTEGRETIVEGYAGHAEGSMTKVFGSCGHTEGYKTQAFGNYSHAEGEGSNAGISDSEGGGGHWSHAEGYYSKALGNYSHAEGYQTTASGLYAHAEGYKSLANTDYSHAEGSNTISGDYEDSVKDVYYTGRYTHAEGDGSVAAGDAAHAEGRTTKALNTAAHAEGRGTTASGQTAHAEGGLTIASENYTHAEGYSTIATGWASHSEGSGTKAIANSQHVEGKWNITANHIHIVGCGTGEDGGVDKDGKPTYRANIHHLTTAGEGWFAKGTSTTNADYAEYYEWLDGNPDDEDRIGLLVTLDGEKIKLANSGDEILGVISGTAAVIGDDPASSWKRKYLTDDFGRVIYEDREDFEEIIVEKINEETGETYEETEMVSLGFSKYPVLNPEYDPTQEYIPRSERSEWDVVGLLGKLYLRDDGTCLINNYVTVGNNGIATFSFEKTNIRVLSRVTDNIIRVQKI